MSRLAPKVTSIQYYRVDRREIAFLKFILEAYDGIGTIRTLDPVQGVISLHIAPGCQQQVTEILRHLKKDILIEPVIPGAQHLDEIIP
jgi:hypothetical protein